ncbi:hypothetical protein CYPRO_1636 [Cyclonatronum proteinivorum]|uniref:VWA domain-containing protein n=1 Tax=Cyclonatronum proteinivorum TaxID=1457365 RepID=A0A345UK85_9BACT|nr:hypothetical protein [Cyclonatronum proteinivorum]AXJ00887.1 hypothetical protein CYPRO_1636 [Cyclonatronum proteinivorum]
MISGFDSDLAILLLALAILFSAAAGWWTYSGNTQLPAGARWTATTLRASALFLLLLLLFNPVYEFTDEREHKQEIAVMLDNSRSVTIEKGDWQGEENFWQVVDQLGLADTSTIRFNTFGFDADLFESDPQELPLTGSVTDINRSLNSLNQASGEMDALILVTDGIFNRGLDPTRAAERLDVPVFTVAIGDTSQVRDVLVRNVIYNSTAFVNATGLIRAEVLNDGFPDRSIEVRLFRNNQLAEVQTIQTTEARSAHQVDFEVDFDEEGTERFRIEIPELEGEWTAANNSYAFTVDVQDDQLRILHLAFEVHPDVGALRQLLVTDESIQSSYMTWTGGSGFVGGSGALPANADTLDLIILHGFPHRQLPNSLREKVMSLASQTNVLFFTLPGTDLENMTAATNNLAPIRRQGNTPIGTISPSVNPAEQDHPIFDFQLPLNLTRGPELRGPVRNYNSAAAARDLLLTNFRNDTTGAPLLSIQQLGNYRVGMVNAWNWFRWQQSTQSEYRDFRAELKNNLIKWASTGVSEGLLEFAPSRNSFDEGEAITFRAAVVTETGLPDNEASVQVSLSSDQIETQSFIMRSIGSGRFRLETRPLPAGTYTYEATALRGTRELDQVQGSFTVNESILELTDTIRRDELLRFIAESTGGAFVTHEQAAQIPNLLRDKGFGTFRTETFTVATRAHHSYWWFLLVILLIGCEWTIRKIYTMP